MSARAIAWSISLASSAGIVLGFALLLLSPDPPPAFANPMAVALPIASMATFAISGPLIVSRWPANPIGWIFCAAAFINALQTVAGGYLAFGLSRALPGSLLAAWVFAWIGMVLVGTLSIFPLLLFPHGTLPSPRWRPVAVAGAVGIALATAAFAFVPGRLAISEAADNPFALRDAAHVIVGAGSVGAVLVVVAVIAAAASIGVRLMSARGIERQQLKVVVLAGSALACAFASIPALGLSASEARLTLGPAFAVLAGAILLAILRFRLYDIDLLIKRTAVYGATSAAIASTFFVGLVALQLALRQLTSGAELAVAASTLASFALFQPIRRRIQDAVDRRFDRSRYDAARTLESFADRLRDEVDLEALRSDLVGAVNQTMGPSHASLWLRDRAR